MMSRGCDTPNAAVYNRIMVSSSKTPGPIDNCHSASALTPNNFKTPGKYGNSPGRKYKNGLTPKNLMATPRRCRTPSGPVYNPFEDHENMHLPTFSPNVFSKITSTPSSSQKTPGKSTFRWSIDQQAILYPADIDEMPHHQEALVSQLHDEQKEEKLQSAIDTFFSSNLFVPSPWTESSTTSRISRIPRDAEKENSSSQSSKDSLGNSQDNTQQIGSKKDTACQTTLTLPPGFDLQTILADYFTYTEQNESTEMLSTSTLRRKLFFQADQPTSTRPSTTGCSVTRSEEKNMTVDTSPSISPLKYNTPCRRRSPIVTPASTQFSSSPIRTGGARSSTCTRHEKLSSPELSPISTPVSKRSTCSPGIQLQFSPSSSQQSIILSSPDISPIKFEDSFSQKEHSSIGSDKNGVNIAGGSPSIDHAENYVHHSRDSIEMCFDAPEMLCRSQNMDMDLSAGNTATPMLEQEPRLGNWGLSIIRECSDSERTNLDMGSGVGYATINQDTGYHTGSLQFTNQDTGILHTNLTQQMSSLPLCSISDMNSDNEYPSKHVDDSGVNFCSSGKIGLDNKHDRENIHRDTGFPFRSFPGKLHVQSEVCSLENSGNVFLCPKEHKPLLQYFPNNQECTSMPASYEVCNSGSLPRMVQSGLGVPIFSWDPSPI